MNSLPDLWEIMVGFSQLPQSQRIGQEKKKKKTQLFCHTAKTSEQRKLGLRL